VETGCSESHVFSLPEPSPLQVFVDYFPASCHDDVASALVEGYGGTPGYLVNWGGIDPQDLPEGSVSFTMTDAQGCTLDSTLEVVIPDTLGFETLVVQEDVGNDASIALDIFGGTLPYSILWNDGTVGDTALTGLGQGVYSWVIEDAQGCLLLGLESIINVGVSSGPTVQGWDLAVQEETLLLSGAPMGAMQVEILAMTGARVLVEPLSNQESLVLSRARLPHHGILRVLDATGQPVFSRIY
jgi:hypothetical protein